VLKNRASRPDPALCGFCKCSHIDEYAALSKTPHALADGLMLVLQHPVEDGGPGSARCENPKAPDINRSSRKPSSSLDRN
jgi:hypothetical protein